MDKYLCERCGKELVFRCAYSRIDHKLICVECDDKEQPKELMKKITDLEAELEEREKKQKYLFSSICEYVSQIEELKQQLAETDKLMQEYLSKCLSLEQQLAEKEKYTYTGKEVGEIEQNYENQIADKDQAIESLQEINQSLGQTCNNDAKEIERLREKLANTTVFAPKISNNADLILQIIESDRVGIDFLKQSQNQTAIAVLEDLKGNYYAYDGIEFLGYIDQQIKALKGEK